VSLKKLLEELDMKGHYFHNAGNDAHYTLAAFLKLAGGTDTAATVE